MPGLIFDEQQKAKLVYLQTFLSEKLQLEYKEISQKDKSKLRRVIELAPVPYFKQGLCYINEETAQLMAGSSHPILKMYGDRCAHFYASNTFSRLVDKKTGLVSNYSAKFNYKVMELLSPVHIAVLIGDMDLVESIIIKLSIDTSKPVPKKKFHWPLATGIDEFGCEAPIAFQTLASFYGDKYINESRNKWGICPMELALICNHKKLVLEFMQFSNRAEDFKLVVEKGNFSIIEAMLLDKNKPITDEILDIAKARNGNLYNYLDLVRKQRIQQCIDKKEPILYILKYFISVKTMQSLRDIIRTHPEVLQVIIDQDGNTLLHEYVTKKNLRDLGILMEAIYAVGFTRTGFDIEKQNNKKQTLLDLALAQDNNEITAIVLMYNPKISKTQQDLIVAAKIDFSVVRHQRDTRVDALTEQQRQRTEVGEEVSADTIMELIATKMELTATRQQLTLQQEQQEGLSIGLMKVAQLTAQNHNSLIGLEQHVCRALPYAPPDMPLDSLAQQPTASKELKALPFYNTKNSPALFAPSANHGQRDNPVASPQFENPVEELKNMRAYMDKLTLEIQQKLQELEALKERVTSFEAHLTASGSRRWQLSIGSDSTNLNPRKTCVEKEQMLALLQGKLSDGTQLGRKDKEGLHHRPGFDMTVSASGAKYDTVR